MIGGREIREVVSTAISSSDGSRLRGAASALIGLAPPSHRDVMAVARNLRALREDERAALGLRSLRVHHARSVTLEPLEPYIAVAAVARGLFIEPAYGDYGSFFADCLDPTGAVARTQPDLLVLFLDVEDVAADVLIACRGADAKQVSGAIAEAAERLSGLVHGARRLTRAGIVVHGLVVPPDVDAMIVVDANAGESASRAIDSLNTALAEACRTAGDAVFFDLGRLAARVGRDGFRDERLFLGSRVPVAAASLGRYARTFVRHVAALRCAPRKVLVSDLDNTLWGGVVGEDGASGIATGTTFPGSSYRPYQSYLARLAERGVLLAIASKNDPETVREAFTARARDIAIGFDTFVSRQIGWHPKPSSIRAIADELSLGLDSFVFVDDSPAECAEVAAAFSEVVVVQVPVDAPWRVVDLIEDTGAFDQLVVTPDDRRRTELYQTRRQLQELEAGVSDRGEFLRSLEMRCSMVSALEAPFERTVQLVAKTNQFNLTTRRHSAEEIRVIASSARAQAWAIRLEDRFGDAGVVGIALATHDGDRCLIDTFLMSCRVIGRGVETALLHRIVENARRAGARTVIGVYTPTKKNGLCKGFYLDHGFTAEGDVFVLDLATGGVDVPEWIQLVTEPS